MSIILFVFSATLIIYTLVGYPLILAIAACFWPKPVEKRRLQKSVSIIIPTHNGARFVAGKLESVLALRYPHFLMDILVVSDGSTDETESIVERFASQGVRLLSIPRGGKCMALNAGISHSTNEILVLTDVRQKLAPDSLQALIGCFADPSVGVVSGNLLIRQGASSDEVSTGLYWRYENWIRRNLSSLDSIFGATGPFYAMRRELTVPLPQDILLDDMYLPLACFFRGYRLIVESRAEAFDYPTSREIEFKRKVRTLAGNYQILRAYPALLGPRNRMWFHFMSHKVSRLMLPWIVALLFVSSWFLPTPFRSITLGAQAAFYGVAALDPYIPTIFPLKSLSSVARTFLALLLAAVWGLSVFFRPPRSLWKETTIGAHHP
jgi:biofilm PGA synthesis N-glycosyltransferase PgaC